MALVAGIDSSTQSTKVEVRDLGSGEIVASGSAPHPATVPPRSEQEPRIWWEALERAWSDAGSPTVDAVSIGAQQHGMVALDADGESVHPAKLWNDTESSPDADALVEALGGPAAWAERAGSVPLPAFTITKLAWLRRTRPEAWARVAHVVLPHDYLTSVLVGAGAYVTDRGDASGTGYWSPADGTYRWDLLELVDEVRDWPAALPTVLGPLEPAGASRKDSFGTAIVGPGSGDNMAAALGVGLRVGDAVMSVGTSGTVYAVSESPTHDRSGAVAGFADATGRFLPLVCTSNATRVLDAVRGLLAVDHETFDRIALAAEPGGPVLLPYFDGERTPHRPDARGSLHGLRTDVTREQVARSAVDGVVCGLLDAFDALTQHAAVTGRVHLVGGGARSDAVRRVAATLLAERGVELVHSDVAEAVATGACVQAAAVLDQVDAAHVQERWGLGAAQAVEALSGVDVAQVRERYALVRDR